MQALLLADNAYLLCIMSPRNYTYELATSKSDQRPLRPIYSSPKWNQISTAIVTSGYYYRMPAIKSHTGYIAQWDIS